MNLNEQYLTLNVLPTAPIQRLLKAQSHSSSGSAERKAEGFPQHRGPRYQSWRCLQNRLVQSTFKLLNFQRSEKTSLQSHRQLQLTWYGYDKPHFLILPGESPQLIDSDLFIHHPPLQIGDQEVNPFFVVKIIKIRSIFKGLITWVEPGSSREWSSNE